MSQQYDEHLIPVLPDRNWVYDHFNGKFKSPEMEKFFSDVVEAVKRKPQVAFDFSYVTNGFSDIRSDFFGMPMYIIRNSHECFKQFCLDNNMEWEEDRGRRIYYVRAKPKVYEPQSDVRYIAGMDPIGGGSSELHLFDVKNNKYIKVKPQYNE